MRAGHPTSLPHPDRQNPSAVHHLSNRPGARTRPFPFDRSLTARRRSREGVRRRPPDVRSVAACAVSERRVEKRVAPPLGWACRFCGALSPARVDSPSSRGATPHRSPGGRLRGRSLLTTSSDSQHGPSFRSFAGCLASDPPAARPLPGSPPSRSRCQPRSTFRPRGSDPPRRLTPRCGRRHIATGIGRGSPRFRRFLRTTPTGCPARPA